MELQFYLLILVLIISNLQRKLEAFFIAWPFIMLAALWFGLNSVPLLGNYFAYFAAGSLFALAKNKSLLKVILPLIIAFFLCINFSAGNADGMSAKKGVEYSSLIISIIIAIFFTFFFVLNSRYGPNLQLPKSSLFGSLTYPIYLIHAHFGYMVISRFATEENKFIVYGLTFLSILSVSYFMHKIIEVKLDRQWRNLFQATLGRVIKLLDNKLSLIRQEKNNKIKVNNEGAVQSKEESLVN